MNNKIILSSVSTLVLLLFLPSYKAETNDRLLEVETSSSPSHCSYLTQYTMDTNYQFVRTINLLYKDSKGTMWIGSEFEGLCKYDGQVYTYYSIKDKKGNQSILDIQEDAKGCILVQTRLGICRLREGVFVPVLPVERADSCTPWISAKEDLCFKTGIKGEIYRWNGSVLTHHYLPSFNSPNEEKKHIAYPNQVYSTLKDQQGNLWLGTMAAGVLQYQDKSFIQIASKGLAHTVNSLFKDSKDRLWIANNESVFLYENQNIFPVLKSEPKSKQGVLSAGKQSLAKVFTIEEDKSGAIWFGTLDSGVWRYKEGQLSQLQSNEYPIGKDVRSIERDNKGLLWIGFANGALCTYDGKTFKQINAREMDGC